jgi:hypothetical protein
MRLFPDNTLFPIQTAFGATGFIFGFLNFVDGIDRLSGNVGKELQLLAA